MRKNLEIKLSWYTPKNWDILIESGYLPVLAIESPEVFCKTPIHIPELSPRGLNLGEYLNYLEKNIIPWKLVNTLDVLFHVSCASRGIVILTEHDKEEYRGVLGKHLGRYLNTEVTEYEYNRN